MPNAKSYLSRKELMWAQDVYEVLGRAFPTYEEAPETEAQLDVLSMPRSDTQTDQQQLERDEEQKHNDHFDILYTSMRKLMKSLQLIRNQREKISDNNTLREFNNYNTIALDMLFETQNILNAESRSDLEAAEIRLAETRQYLSMMQEIIDRLNAVPPVNPIESKNEEEKRRLHSDITRISEENEELHVRTKTIKDNAALDVYNSMYNKVLYHLTKASGFLDNNLFKQCDETIQDAHISMDSARMAFEYGIDITSKSELHLADLKSIKEKTEKLLKIGESLPETTNNVKYLRRNKAARKAVNLAEVLIEAGETKSARKILEQIKGEVRYLETYFSTPTKQSNLKRRNAIKKKSGDEHDRGPFADPLPQYQDYIQHWFSDAESQEVEKLLSDLYSPNIADHSKVKSFKRLQALASPNYSKNFKIIETDEKRVYSLLDFELQL